MPSASLFSSAIVISGIELLYDYSMLNLFSLQTLLANMGFRFKKQLEQERPVFLYSSRHHNNECTTMIFLVNSNIKKVRYLNVNLERFIETY